MNIRNQMEYCTSCFLVKTENIICHKCMKKIFGNEKFSKNVNIDVNEKQLYDHFQYIENKELFDETGINQKSFAHIDKNQLILTHEPLSIENKTVQFLLKVNEDGPEYNINEQISQQIMNLLIDNKKYITPSFIVTDNNNDYIFLTKMFTHNNKGQLNKSFKSFDLLEREFDKKLKSQEDVFEFIKKKNLLKYYEEEKYILFKMFLTDFIISNYDRHTGNFGILFNLKEKQGVLSPIFDTSNSFCHNNIPALKIFKNNEKATLKSFNSLASKIGIQQKEFQNILNDIQKKIPIIKKIINNSPLDHEDKNDFHNLIEKSLKILNIDYNTEKEMNYSHLIQ